MELTQTHIEELYKFTRAHYVEHYDVQTELVDHLANDIEQIWSKQPKISFEEARDMSFQKFGVFGFMEVVEAKQKQLGKKYAKILWGFLKEWFSMPKLISTGFLFYFFYSFLDLQTNAIFCIVVVLLLAIIETVLVIRLLKKAKQRFKAKKRKYLLEEIIFKTGVFNTIVLFANFFQYINFTEGITAIWGKCVVAGVFTLAIIFSYITLIVIPQKAEELLKETYPEYKQLNAL